MSEDRRALGLAYADMLERVWDRMSGLAGDFDEATWALPALPGWSVKDIYSHIIGTERLLAGLPPDDRLSPEDAAAEHLRNPMGVFNEQAVAARRATPGAAVAAEFADLAARRLSALRAADEATFAAAMDTPIGPGDLTGFLGIRVMDCWVHEQDVRIAVGRPGGVEGPEVERSLDVLTAGVPMVLGKRVGAPDGTHLRVEITGNARRQLDVGVTGGRAGVLAGDAAQGEPTSTIGIDLLAYVMLAAGRASAHDVGDEVSISGDAALAEAVLGALNVIP